MQQFVVTQIYERAQKKTARKFYCQQVQRRSLLGLKYFAKFSLKNKYMNDLALARLRQTLASKVFTGLHFQRETRRHKYEKLRIALLFNDLKVQTYAFRYVRVALQVIKRDRIFSLKAAKYREFKLLEIYFATWQTFKLKQTRNRLNWGLATKFRDRKLARRLFGLLLQSNRMFKRIYDPEKFDLIYQQNLLHKAFGVLNEYKTFSQEKFSMLPQDPKFYFYTSLWLEHHDLAAKETKRGLKLQLHYNQMVSQVYLRGALEALFFRYAKIKQFKTRRHDQVKRKVLSHLRRTTIILKVRSYKCSIVQSQTALRLFRLAFDALRLRCKNKQQLKAIKKLVAQGRLEKIRFKHMAAWWQLLEKKKKARKSKELSQQMHDHKIINVYLRCWINNYNKRQKKKYLNQVRESFVIQNRRNKLFKRWVAATSNELSRKIYGEQLYDNYLDGVKDKVFKELRFNIIKQKRERLITDIIKERQENLLVSRVLAKWRQRYLSHLQKRTLFWQLDQDFNQKLVRKTFEALLVWYLTQKEHRIKKMLA